MAKVCELTGRKTSFGNRKQHRRGSSGSGGTWNFKAPKTRRQWKPNLRVNIDGQSKTIKVSMKAYKKLRKMALTEVTN